ncbi:TIGR04076 family protein [Candidatus Zixiibacteriota bacterium]
MYELKVTVTKVMGTCTADPDMKPGDFFTVSDGNIRLPEGGYICLYALQNLIPLLPVKEREILEDTEDDWMWRVHHAQCPDPDGRVIFKIERTGTIGDEESEDQDGSDEVGTGGSEGPGISGEPPEKSILKDLTVTVESVNGTCTSPMEPGDSIDLRSGRLYIPPGSHFCLYALQSLLPLLPAKQRLLQDGDWMIDDHHVICPDPAGNVIMRIDRKE